MAFSYGDYNDGLDHTLKAEEEENTDSLFLFANNNAGTAENLGFYRLYDMKIEGDSEGVTEGIDYVDCLIGDTASYINTGITVSTGYKIDVIFMTTVEYHKGKGNGNLHFDCIYGASNPLYYSYDNSNGTSVGLINYNIGVRDNDSGGDGYTSYPIKNNCLNKKYTLSRTLVNVSNRFPIYIFANNNSINNTAYAESICDNTVRIYDFKIYDTEENLLIHLRPCLDTSKVPCMYDEVTKRYFYNRGTGTFGYKKKLRDFQPVLDKNNVPCLMDKINKKYYYAKNGNTFNCREQIGYRGVSYLQGDYNSYIDTGLRANEMHGYTIEIQYKRVTDYSRGNQLVFGSSRGGFDSSEVNCHLRYNYYGYPQGLSYSDEVSNAIYNPSVSTIINATFTINTPSSTSSFYLFAGNSNDSPIGTCDATIYYWKIYDTNSNLVQHLVPALDSNNVPCMYDKVSQQFFYNQGAGTFSYGIEELDGATDTYTPITYIESNGTQYIDTGVVPTDNTDINMVCRACKEYTKVEYIQGDGASWLNTNIIPNTSTKVVVDAYSMFSDSPNGVPLFGAVVEFLSYSFQTTGKWLYVGKLGSKYNVGHNDLDSSIFEGRHIISIDLSDTTNIVNVDGINYGECTATTTECSKPILLFNQYDRWGNTVLDTLSTAKIYSFKIYQLDELIFYGIPALDSSNTPCLYDKVSQQFFYNQGEGTFTVGETVDKNYIMNNVFIQYNYTYKDNDTNIQPNITVSEGATLTLGSTNLSYLSEEEIEQATSDGWTLE